MTKIEEAIAYVRKNKTWKDWEDAQALDNINNREPIPIRISEEIYDLMEEWSEDNDMPENWWLVEMDEEDIFLEL